MMRRLLLWLCVAAILLTFGGCKTAESGVDVDPSPATTAKTTTASSTPDTAPPVNLIGTWNALVDYAPSLAQLGVETDDADVTVRCTFGENGIYQFEAQSADFYDVVRPHVDVLIKKMATASGATPEEYLELQGLTKDSFIPYFVELAGFADGMSSVYGTFRFEGRNLIMDDEPAEYVYDGNSITITSMEMTVVFTPYTPPVTQPITTTTVPAVRPDDLSLVGTWQGEYAMDMLGFETGYSLMQTVTYEFAEDGTFKATAGIPTDTIETFLDNVLEEHGKTCEEMFGADRQTVIDEVIAVTVGTIDNGTYLIDGTSVTLTADEFLFTASLNGDVLTVDDGGIAYPCRKINE